MTQNYQMGKGLDAWNSGNAQTITFIVTEDCNLRCKYCYITHKKSNKVMDFEIAKKAIDYLLSNKITKQDAVIIEFIGGEPFLEVELIDRVTDYFKIQSYLSGSQWAWNYRISICTNGVNYLNENIQKYIDKNYLKLSISITIDGTKEKHDLQRVFENGTGSYDTILPAIPVWISKFATSTKVTFASEDLQYLCSSIIDLWNLGITEVASNVVFEDVWKDEDDKILEEQLMELADYVIENQIYNKVKCTFFDDKIGIPYSKEDMDSTHCGAGKMLAIGTDGKLYPCIRYKDYSLNKKEEWIFGDIYRGIDMEAVRPFMLAANKYQSDQECLECPIAVGCGFCQGLNYDEAETSTNFYRVKYICKMHKARVRANNYYFSLLFNKYGIRREQYTLNSKKLFILLSDNYVSFCQYENKKKSSKKLSIELLDKALEYAHENFFSPIIIHSSDEFIYKNKEIYNKYTITHLIPFKFYDITRNLRNAIYIFNHDDKFDFKGSLENIILNVDSNKIADLSDLVKQVLPKVNRLNINVQNLDNQFNLDVYKNQLLDIRNEFSNKFTNKEINIISDILFLNEHRNCKAGYSSYTLAPTGKIYVCPAFYSNNPEEYIGDMVNGIDKRHDLKLFRDDMQPLCLKCDAYQCQNCFYLNKMKTKEVNVSPSYQCKKSLLERNLMSLDKNGLNEKGGSDIQYFDSIGKVLDKEKVKIGFYKYEGGKIENE